MKLNYRNFTRAPINGSLDTRFDRLALIFLTLFILGGVAWEVKEMVGVLILVLLFFIGCLCLLFLEITDSLKARKLKLDQNEHLEK